MRSHNFTLKYPSNIFEIALSFKLQKLLFPISASLLCLIDSVHGLPYLDRFFIVCIRPRSLFRILPRQCIYYPCPWTSRLHAWRSMSTEFRAIGNKIIQDHTEDLALDSPQIKFKDLLRIDIKLSETNTFLLWFYERHPKNFKGKLINVYFNLHNFHVACLLKNVEPY